MSQQSRPTSKLMLMSRSGCGRMADVALARARDLTPRPRADTFYVRGCTFYVYAAHFMSMLHISCLCCTFYVYAAMGCTFFVCALTLSYSANHFTTCISFIWFLTLVYFKGSQITCGKFWRLPTSSVFGSYCHFPLFLSTKNVKNSPHAVLKRRPEAKKNCHM